MADIDVDISTVRRWACQCNEVEEQTPLAVQKWSSKPLTAVTPRNFQRIDDIIRCDCRMAADELYRTSSLCKGSVMTFVWQLRYSKDRFKFTILNAVLVSNKTDLTALVDAEARVMLLYCTREEAIEILTAAKHYHITGENYVWVVTQSVIENPLQPSNQFPVGML
ncbi:Nmdar2, partial [Trypoxylus dichotomus]